MAWTQASAVSHMPIDFLALYNAPVMPFATPVNLDAINALMKPGRQSPPAEARKSRRRRGGKAVAERRLRMKNWPAAEKRRDPTDGSLRTWEEFMMKHAQGACFDEADRLWAMAENEDDDGPPPLVDDIEDSPISEEPGTPPSVNFVFESSLESDESVGLSDSGHSPGCRMLIAALNEQ